MRMGSELWTEDFTASLGKGLNMGKLEMEGVTKWSLEVPPLSPYAPLEGLAYLSVFPDARGANQLFAGGLPSLASWVSEVITIPAHQQPVQVVALVTNAPLTADADDFVRVSIR